MPKAWLHLSKDYAILIPEPLTTKPASMFTGAYISRATKKAHNVDDHLGSPSAGSL